MNVHGRLVPLKTLYEVEIKESLVDAFVVEFPVQLADKVVNVLKSAFVIKGWGTYYFLRRLVPTRHLPPHLRDDVSTRDDCSTIHLIIPPPVPPTADDVVATLQPYINSKSRPVVRMAKVPQAAPTTAEQAVRWSKEYWPCIFNPASQSLQQAPPFHVLRSVLAELDNPSRLELYFRLAERAAAACEDCAVGRRVAAVVVNPLNGEVIAVAGDGRCFSRSDCRGSTASHLNGSQGRPEQHALMRAIAMVAEKERLRTYSEMLPGTATKIDDPNLGEKPLTPIENMYAPTCAQTSVSDATLSDLPKGQTEERSDAYLCNGLDVYLTHEPCIACSMAMVHSRFRACIFNTRMTPTGGLWADRSDGGLGYGLFWRKELNWRVLTFQYLISRESQVEDDDAASNHPSGQEWFHA